MLDYFFVVTKTTLDEDESRGGWQATTAPREEGRAKVREENGGWRTSG